jgi:hypothetical protein
MDWRWAVLAAAAVVCGVAAMVLALAGGGPDRAACKAALSAQVDYAMAHPGAAAPGFTRACKGISSSDLEKLVAELLAGK